MKKKEWIINEQIFEFMIGSMKHYRAVEKLERMSTRADNETQDEDEQ